MRISASSIALAFGATSGPALVSYGSPNTTALVVTAAVTATVVVIKKKRSKTEVIDLRPLIEARNAVVEPEERLAA